MFVQHLLKFYNWNITKKVTEHALNFSQGTEKYLPPPRESLNRSGKKMMLLGFFHVFCQFLFFQPNDFSNSDV